MKNKKILITFGMIIVILLILSQVLPYLIKDTNENFLLPESDVTINPFDQRAYVHVNDLLVTVKSHGIVEFEVYEEFVCEPCIATDINVDIGDYVYKDELLFKDVKTNFKGKITDIEYNEEDTQYTIVMQNLEKPSVNFYINQKDTEKIKINQETTIYYNNLIFEGSIISIAEEFLSGQLLIKASINDDEHIIRPNAFVNVSVNIHTKKNVLVLSKYAVYYQDDETYVNVLVKDDDGLEKIVLTKIIVGLEGDAFVQVISGVKKGDLVVFSSNNIGEDYD